MIDSTESGAVVDQGATRASELMVEADGGGEGEEALQDALPEALKCSGAVALEREGPLAAPEDALDALADRCEVRAFAGLVLAARSEHRRLQFACLRGEVAPGVALVADQRSRRRRGGRASRARGRRHAHRVWERPQ